VAYIPIYVWTRYIPYFWGEKSNFTSFLFFKTPLKNNVLLFRNFFERKQIEVGQFSTKKEGQTLTCPRVQCPLGKSGAIVKISGRAIS